jgi:NAD(P)-dependent dehydrogenase (short-subunit alcohol dehydrogenase family)
VVNMTSIVGSRVHPFASAAYATSKAALAALTRELAADFGRSGVRVNAVSPGEIETAILSAGTEEIVERSIPLRRLGQPKEVADLLFFLCSDQARYINGSEVHIDGGQRV